jgi:putative pyruvate formate lyase activating enzyme
LDNGKEKKYEPGYLALYRSGELERRARVLETRLAACDICPRDCGVNRLVNEKGFCHSGGRPIVSSVCSHHGEEPVLSGTRGSGTIFFGNCNLRCAYCQNYQISQDYRAQQVYETDVSTLAEKLLYLQNELLCHNINFVSPSHFVPQILRAVLEAVPRGLHLPLVYNTSGYDSLETIRALEGIISIYLPDLRYASNEMSHQYSYAGDYVERARDAIKEMYRQVGDLEVDDEDVARKGLIVRHLILPNGIAGSEESLRWLVREISPEITASIMAQYYPAYHASRFALLNRKITQEEHAQVAALVEELGIVNGWMQELEAAENYLPDFSQKDMPFPAES